MAHRTQEYSLLPILLIYYKRIELGDSQTEEMRRARCGGGDMAFPRPLQLCHPASTAIHSATQKLSKSLSLGLLEKLH